MVYGAAYCSGLYRNMVAKDRLIEFPFWYDEVKNANKADKTTT